MLIEEMFLQQVGAAMLYAGLDTSWEAVHATLTDAQRFRALALDPRVPEGIRRQLTLRMHLAQETDKGALEWIRTVALVRLYMEKEDWRARTDEWWSTTARTWGAPAKSSSPAS